MNVLVSFKNTHKIGSLKWLKFYKQNFHYFLVALKRFAIDTPLWRPLA